MTPWNLQWFHWVPKWFQPPLYFTISSSNYGYVLLRLIIKLETQDDTRLGYLMPSRHYAPFQIQLLNFLWRHSLTAIVFELLTQRNSGSENLYTCTISKSRVTHFLSAHASLHHNNKLTTLSLWSFVCVRKIILTEVVKESPQLLSDSKSVVSSPQPRTMLPYSPL